MNVLYLSILKFELLAPFYLNVCMIVSHLIMLQCDYSFAGDYITIYDINGISTVISSLTGSDIGPYQPYNYPYHYSHWQKKVISSTGNNMLVEFRSDEIYENIGFSALIHYSPLPSKECEKGLDMTKKTIQSPNFPDSYTNNLSCKWLISVPYGSHITLKFLQLDVGFCNFNI